MEEERFNGVILYKKRNERQAGAVKKRKPKVCSTEKERRSLPQ
jgi:hypothetical protein